MERLTCIQKSFSAYELAADIRAQVAAAPVLPISRELRKLGEPRQNARLFAKTGKLGWNGLGRLDILQVSAFLCENEIVACILAGCCRTGASLSGDLVGSMDSGGE